MSNDVWYFAYGSNLLTDQMIERTGPIRTGDESPWIGRLQDYRLAFNKRSTKYVVCANIVRSPGDVVIGVAYRCGPDAMTKLDEEEKGYERQPVTVVRNDVFSVEAVSYVALKRRVVNGLQPSKEYLNTILDGATQHVLPAEYIEKIKRIALGDVEGRSHDSKG